MLKKGLLFGLAMLCVMATTFAQDKKEEVKDGWKYGAGLGLDFAQLLQFNPKVGAGQDKIGFGGAFNTFANLKRGRLAWDNKAALQLGVIRFGSGTSALTGGDGVPYQKSIDQLRLESKAGYSIKEGSKYFYAADFTFLSQLTPSYSQDGKVFYTKEVEGGALFSKLFSPATITFSLGMDYKHSDKLSFFYSPIGLKTIIVNDDDLAALGIHGNEVTKDANGLITDFKNSDFQVGSMLKGAYADKFLNDRLQVTSSLSLFSNYLNEPQNIDVDWNNEFAIEIFKGLQLSLLLNVFYDHDVKVQVTDYDAVGGLTGNLSRRTSITEQFLIKYNLVF